MRSNTLTYDATPHVRLGAPPQTRRRPDRYRYGPALGEWSSPAGLHRRPWLARLRHALHEDLFAVHFQPIVSLRDGHAAHYEALVRLADEPDGRLIAPGRFLPAAERYGLVRDIDRMVLDRVLALLAARKARTPSSGAGGGRQSARPGGHPGARLGGHPGGRPGARIAINLSALSVTDPTMLAHIAGAIDRHGIDPALLVIEITETAAISDMERARAFCSGVSALGCAVALDDFGAGFGSFQYLTRLPFDYLKIDGSFVRALPSSLNDQLVVQALAGLARGMGVQTIAEYATDRPTVELLRRYGVDYAQGFELGRPHPL
jgi:EAL domain-containing protein (putative c-di-GMP-specific phosphodiesterase class I)